MSTNKGGRRGFRGNRNNKNFESKTIQDESNPIILAFKNYANELDLKHDKFERILKQGRDITIESKRIIFLLHTIDSKKQNAETVLEEAKKRLYALCDTNFLNIAKELGELDPYQYARAFSPGLQEFVEAYTFYEYLNGSSLSNWDDLQEKLKYEVPLEKPAEKDKGSIIEPVDKPTKSYKCLVQPTEFILGLADLSGEIMRRCINSLGSGDIDTCFKSCKVMQSFYSGYMSLISPRNRELSRKIYTLRQSVIKTENVCYNVKVRGGEAAKWGAVEPITSDKNDYDDDEGFY